MKRSGFLVTQPTNYKAFIPSNLPPSPTINIDTEMQELLQDATILLARLDGIAYTLPNSEIFIAMYVKKEALLSSQIEGTQASLEDIFEFERGSKPENINDVSEVINYIKALDYGIKRLGEIPMSLKLIKELHAIILQKTRGANKTPDEFEMIHQEFKITHQSASKLINDFEHLEILREITGKKRDRKFAYHKYLEILSEGTKPI